LQIRSTVPLLHGRRFSFSTAWEQVVSRERTDLDGEWEFYPDPKQQLTRDSLRQEDARPIRVPGPWQAQFDDLRDYSGVAWYRRRFDVGGNEGTRERGNEGMVATLTRPVAPSVPRTAFILHFGAVDYFATVWLNGRQVGEHEGGYLPFEIDVTDALRHDAPNELTVRVIDPGNDADFLPDFTFAEIPHGKQSWYGPVGGLWQSVYLERRPANHLTGLRITPDVPGEQVRVRASLNRASDRPLGLWLNVTDPKGQVRRHRLLLPAGVETEELTVPVPEPMLWDTTTPNLYELQAVLLDGNDDRAEPLDTLSSKFGMRTIATSPSGHLLLNGRVLYLRGALDQDY
jgi:beta-galactosidase/beta-glucuronidase